MINLLIFDDWRETRTVAFGIPIREMHCGEVRAPKRRSCLPHPLLLPVAYYLISTSLLLSVSNSALHHGLYFLVLLSGMLRVQDNYRVDSYFLSQSTDDH